MTESTPDRSSSSNTNTTLIGRIARKMKRKQGIELAVRANSINGDDPPPDLPPIVVCIPKNQSASMVQHFVMVQLDALVRVCYVEDTSVWCQSRVTSLELLECPGEPQAVQAILKEPSLWYSLKPFHSVTMDPSEEEEEELDLNAKNQHYVVRKIVARLQRRQLETPRERPPVVRYHTIQALEALESETHLVDIATDNKIDMVCLPADGHWNLPEQGEVIIQSNHGKLTRQEYLEQKKHPQIGWLLARLQKLYTAWPFRHVLDVGGGRGDLAIRLAQQFPDTQVSVVDLNETSLQGGAAFAERLGVGCRMHWIHQDFRDYAKNTPDIDLVIAWHACGDLSDLALQVGVERQAAVAVCPCCYSKLSTQTVATQLAELHMRPDLSRRGMHVVNSKRYENLAKQGYSVSLEEYAKVWSGRNQVLIAYPEKSQKGESRQWHFDARLWTKNSI